MTNVMKFLILNAAMLLFVLGGFVYLNNDEAISTQPLDLQFIDFTEAETTYPYLDLSSESGLGTQTADNKCGSEVCGKDECCCLNVDTQAQCCRPKVDDNCVASCQKSEPC